MKKLLLVVLFVVFALSCNACGQSETGTKTGADTESATNLDSVSDDAESSQGRMLGDDIELRVYQLYFESLGSPEDSKFFMPTTQDYCIMYSNNQSDEGISYTLKLYSFDDYGDCADLIIKEIYPTEEMALNALANEANYIEVPSLGFTSADFDNAETSVESCIASSELILYKHSKNHDIPKAKEQLVEDANYYIDSASQASYTDYATDPYGCAFSSESSEFGFWFSTEVIDGNFFDNYGEGPER